MLVDFLDRNQNFPCDGLKYMQKIHSLKINGIRGKEVMDLAKDGTQRGGRRPRAGCKPQPLAEKLQEGKKPCGSSCRP